MKQDLWVSRVDNHSSLLPEKTWPDYSQVECFLWSCLVQQLSAKQRYSQSHWDTPIEDTERLWFCFLSVCVCVCVCACARVHRPNTLPSPHSLSSLLIDCCFINPKHESLNRWNISTNGCATLKKLYNLGFLYKAYSVSCVDNLKNLTLSNLKEYIFDTF